MAELDSAPLIVMDPSDPASEEALDKAVRAAASLCVWLARKRRLRGAAAGRPAPDRHRPRPRRLARGARAPGARRGGRRPRRQRARPARRRGDLGHGRRPSRPRRGRSSGCPPGRATWSRPARCPGVRAAFEVAGCTGCLVERARRATGARSGGMSGVLGRTPAPATAGAPPRVAPRSARTAAAVTRDSLAMRLVAFAALAAFGAAHWGMLVEDAPVGPHAPCAARGHRRRRRARPALAARRSRGRRCTRSPPSSAWRCSPSGLMAAGLPGRLLLPGALERVRRRPRPRPRGHAGRRVALRRTRRRGSAARSCWARPRFSRSRPRLPSGRPAAGVAALRLRASWPCCSCTARR